MERQLSSRESDKELQLQEMLCLSSLLTAEEFQQTAQSSGTLDIFPFSDAKFRVFTAGSAFLPAAADFFRTVSAFDQVGTGPLVQEFIEMHSLDGPSCLVRHLPSIQVAFSFPENYPSESPPNITTRCPCIRLDTLRKLEEECVQLWMRTGKMAVIYAVYEFLMGVMENLAFFPYGPVLILVPDADEDLAKQSPASNVILVNDAAAVVNALVTWDMQREDTVFRSGIQQCPICLVTRDGKDYKKLTNCGHWCCPDCLQTACSTHITEGSVRLIKCMECDAEIHPFDVVGIIGVEDAEKYQRLQLNSALNGMGDIVYCPRPGCGEAVVRDTDNVAQCSCGYVFCAICRRSSHGVAPCRFDNISALEEKLSALSTETEKDSFRVRLLRALNEAKSELYLDQEAKRCPGCWSALQKHDGCNHITCHCGCHFCWMCMKQLPKANPYEHFKTSGNDCNGRLWDNLEAESAPLPDEQAINRAVDEVAEQLVPTPDRWVDDVDMELEMRLLLRRQMEGLDEGPSQP